MQDIERGGDYYAKEEANVRLGREDRLHRWIDEVRWDEMGGREVGAIAR